MKGSLDNALCQHGVSHLLEAGDIGASHVVAFTVVFLAGAGKWGAVNEGEFR